MWEMCLIIFVKRSQSKEEKGSGWNPATKTFLIGLAKSTIIWSTTNGLGSAIKIVSPHLQEAVGHNLLFYNHITNKG